MLYRVKSTGRAFPTFEAARADLADSHLRVFEGESRPIPGSGGLRCWFAYDAATGYCCDRLDQARE